MNQYPEHPSNSSNTQQSATFRRVRSEEHINLGFNSCWMSHQGWFDQTSSTSAFDHERVCNAETSVFNKYLGPGDPNLIYIPLPEGPRPEYFFSNMPRRFLAPPPNPGANQRRFYLRRSNSSGGPFNNNLEVSRILKVLQGRCWKQVKSDKTSAKHSFQFTLMSYNVLAQKLLDEHPYLYQTHNCKDLAWKIRWKNLFNEIKTMRPDILCLQEVQQSHLKGYFKPDRLKLVEFETVEFYQPNVSILDRDNIAIVAKFCPKNRPNDSFIVPSSLQITDQCQHACLLEKRLDNNDISRAEEAALIKLFNTDKAIPKLSTEGIKSRNLFSSGTLSHLFAFKSVYCAGSTEDPEATTFQDQWITVDYIFYTGKKEGEEIEENKLKLVSVYRLPLRSELGSIKIPNSLMGSDHLSLAAKYILSYFRNQEPELSNDDVTQILAQDTEHTNHWRDNLGPKAPTHREQFKNEYNFATKTGVITGHNDDTYVIDNLLEFTPEDEQFELGDTVSYQQLFSDEICIGKIAIYNVNLISNDWDRVAEKQSIVTTRIMISKVERRDKRIMILTPGNIKVDLDKVSIEFVPSVGDWLELDVKYEVDEQTLDLSGKVIEVNKISPIRPHIQSGKITSWDALEGTGSISSKIFVDKNAIRCGYIPVVGDQVLAEIIESDQLNCTWRALKILPEHWSKKVQSGKSANVSKMKESHPGLEISYPPLTFDKLGVSKSFTIALSNQSQDLLELKVVETSECSQVHFAEPILDNKPILPEYAAPKKLLDLVIKYGQDRDNPSFIEELKVAKPSLFTNLNHMNYEEKFHTLLHMEEITNLMLIRQYDQDRACFIKNGEFLMLEIENLAERRPSIVLGDRIIASDTLTQTNQEYEGNVYKVGAKHVYLKFSLLFHDKYNGEDYSIRVIPGRASFKRQHHAVYLAARHLGRKWLFPTQVVQKEPQLNFVYESYLNAIEESKHAAISNKHSENSGTTGHFKADVINQDGNIVTNIDEAQPCKLEW
ncbi:hypothetical protein HUJ05_008884 [Dendroctonus ponderosae]|nr:hypothetical protein HUJ05_008884 [Dendroctonus ponderosae]